MVSAEELTDDTVEDLRKRVRSLIESDVGGGYHPLRKYEKHRAYYALTEEKLEDDPSNGEVSYRLLEHVANGPYGERDLEVRDPYDCGGPLTKPEMVALVSALQDAAGDEEVGDEE